MVNYADFYVNPLMAQQQGVSNVLAAGRMRDLRQQAADQSALASRGMDLKEQALGIQQGYLDMTMEEKQRKVALQRLEFLANGLDSVNDQDSLNNYKSVVESMQNAGLFDAEMPDLLPDVYDRPRVEKIKDQLKTALGQLEWGPSYAGPRGSKLQRSRITGAERAVVGQAGTVPRDTSATQTLDQKVGDLENQYRNMQSRFFQDAEMRMYREGPPTDPDLYKRLQLESTRAMERDRKLLKENKPAHYMDDILEEVHKAETEWGAIEAGLGDPTDPANVKDADGNPVKFRDKDTGNVFQSDGYVWKLVKEGSK